jgi:hypothetical protein
MPPVEFPRRTLLPNLLGTFLHDPTGVSAAFQLHGEQKENLPLHVNRDDPPSLFKTVHAPQRDPQELGQFPLGLAQTTSDFAELLSVHG